MKGHVQFYEGYLRPFLTCMPSSPVRTMGMSKSILYSLLCHHILSGVEDTKRTVRESCRHSVNVKKN